MPCASPYFDGALFNFRVLLKLGLLLLNLGPQTCLGPRSSCPPPAPPSRRPWMYLIYVDKYLFLATFTNPPNKKTTTTKKTTPTPITKTKTTTPKPTKKTTPKSTAKTTQKLTTTPQPITGNTTTRPTSKPFHSSVSPSPASIQPSPSSKPINNSSSINPNTTVNPNMSSSVYPNASTPVPSNSAVATPTTLHSSVAPKPLPTKSASKLTNRKKVVNVNCSSVSAQFFPQWMLTQPEMCNKSTHQTNISNTIHNFIAFGDLPR